MEAKTINCKTCGQPFVARDPRKMYCSPRCNSKSIRLRKRKLWDAPRKCRQCGKEFKPFTKRNVYCSDKCKVDYGNAHKAYVHTCVGCSTEFTSRNPGTKYCTRSCALAHTVVERLLTCEDCGAEFTFIGRTRKHRCPHCHRRYWNDYYADAMTARGTTHWSNSGTYANNKVKLSAERRAGYRAASFAAWGSDCIICGRDHSETGAAVDVHHVDGDLCNITVTNIIPLCRRCHGRVHSLARRGTFKTRVTASMLQAALFEFWPEGQQVIGISMQQCIDDNTANSGNAKS